MGQFSHVVEMFLEKGDETTALRESARFGEYELLEELLDRGVPVDSTTGDGVTPLILASSGGKRRCVKLLLERGANVNAVSRTHQATPLIALMSWPHQDRVYVAVARLLLQAGADPTCRDDEGLTALDWARERGCLGVIELLSAAEE